ncbi:hypothetical protein OC846_004729 [Tilletia horrida]|uniref:Uncharacterized protein n=1 Tax=Tilletia horrida TaxID=155126 RepID=A0AAN6JWN5_9BASI|nr:hypothetical protein OC845_005218 [Tilletia horrida]KAK0547767.1 hypothetical protein OC846_004729 [Tilletia horrida]
MAKEKNVSRGARGRTRNNNSTHAANRIQRKNAAAGSSSGPSSILGVYDYVVNNQGSSASKEQDGSKKRKRTGDRASRRVAAGADDSLPSSSNSKRRRRHDDDDEQDNDEDDEEEALSDSERVKAPAIFSDGEEDGEGPAFEGEDEDIDSDEAFGESDEERYEGWALSGSKAKKANEDEDEDFDDDENAVDLDQMLNAVSDGEDEGANMDDDEQDGVDGLDEFTTVTGPSDFHDFDEDLGAPGASSGAGPVTLEDLLAPLDQDASLGTADLRKRVSALSSEKRGKAKAGGAAVDTKTGALAAPLPSILQDRVDRSAAYGATKDQVEGWQPTLKRLREAEHLSFPLQKQPEIKSSNASLVASMLSTKASSATRSALEMETGDLLRAAQMTDSQISKQEALVMNKLDPALVEERRRELARMRELMFRAEQKAKRQSKIKSKSYRKIQRKEKEKLKQKMAEAGLDVGGGDDDDDEVDYEADNADRIRAERERAKERATLKHKNTGQWAKTMVGRRERDSETAAAIGDQLRRGQELRQKIQGDDDEDDSDEYDDEQDSDDDEEEEEGDGFGGPAQVQGRQKFGSESRFRAAEAAGVAAAQKAAAEADAASKAAIAKAAAAKRADKSMSKSKAARSAAALDDARVEIDDGTDLTGLIPTSAASRAAIAVPSQGQTRSGGGKGGAEEPDAGSDSDMSDEDGAGVTQVLQGQKGSSLNAPSDTRKKGRGIEFSQRDLVAEAFAGDDVAAQFAEEKQALIDADAPKEEDNSLPGWGSWAGKGVSHSKAQKARIEANRKAHTKKIPGVLPSQRKDAGMGHVIINERVDKKLDKYKVKDLPHPYTSAAQYEMVMRNSMGAEWNTRTQHQRMTLPKVVTKPGKAIQPIERKF